MYEYHGTYGRSMCSCLYQYLSAPSRLAHDPAEYAWLLSALVLRVPAFALDAFAFALW